MSQIDYQVAVDEARDQVVLFAMKFMATYYEATDDFTWLDQATDDLNSVLKTYVKAFNARENYMAPMPRPKKDFFLHPYMP